MLNPPSDSGPGEDDVRESSQHIPYNTGSTTVPAGTPLSQQLPFRFREDVFQFYAPTIAKAMQSDEGVVVNPSPLRSTTYAARIRDAIIAKKRFDWPASF